MKLGKKFRVIKTDTYALNPSKNKVAKPKIFLPVLRTLVAPILPEPIFLISFLRKIFVRTKPKGIEPNTYE